MPSHLSNIVDVYIVREHAQHAHHAHHAHHADHADHADHARHHRHEFLQMRRVESPLRGTWQPLMGHIEPGETAVATALRELHEEVGLHTNPADPALHELLALEQVHPYFLAELDAIVFSPRFVALVDPAWSPTLNQEHDAHRWVSLDQLQASFMWPGQRAACAEILEILSPDNLAREHLRVKLATTPRPR